jgi:hypothetical protein
MAAAGTERFGDRFSEALNQQDLSVKEFAIREIVKTVGERPGVVSSYVTD